LLGLSAHSALNSLAVMRYRSEFGDGNTYPLYATLEEQPENLRIAAAQPGHELFGKDVSYTRLNKLISQGGVATVELHERDNLNAFKARNPDAIALFVVDPKGTAHAFTTVRSPSPAQSWKLIAVSAMFTRQSGAESTGPNNGS
jgi:hypothetical protein